MPTMQSSKRLSSHHHNQQKPRKGRHRRSSAIHIGNDNDMNPNLSPINEEASKRESPHRRLSVVVSESPLTPIAPIPHRSFADEATDDVMMSTPEMQNRTFNVRKMLMNRRHIRGE